MTDLRRTDINDLISQIKEECNFLWVAYDATKERMFCKHILEAKAFGEFCEKVNQERTKFALNVLRASVMINYRKGACSWPMKIYFNYTDVYNQTILAKQKQYTKSSLAPLREWWIL